MDVSQISTSTAATATAINQSQNKIDAQLAAIKNESENQQQIVQLLDEAIGKGQKINVTA
jgi:hypothetical protein